MAIRDALIEQWDRTWGMLRDAIQNFPENQWRTGDDDYSVPARLALHAVDTAAFYAYESPEAAPNPIRFHVDWKEAAPAELPSRDEILQFLADTQKGLSTWLAAQDDGQMCAKNAFEWTGGSVLSRMIYSVRHLQHHAAELNLELHRRGLNSADWR